jgi:hypothetical protein
MPRSAIIAMWSGPRNLSTALMRSFAQRADTICWDEPFYAAYLAATGIDHPMREEVIAAGIIDPLEVARRCATSPRDGRIHYQKHMTHHMIAAFTLDWVDGVTNAFLIRAPERVLASYVRKREEVSAAEIGLARQRQLFDRAADRTGSPPPVIDSQDIRAKPEAALRALCGALEIGFDPAMLSWPKGPHRSDGIWAPHWYDAIWNSTGFAPPEGDQPGLPDELARIADAVRPDYEFLRAFRLAV